MVLPGQSAEFVVGLFHLPIAIDSDSLAMRVGGKLASFDRQLAAAAATLGVEVV